MGITVAVMQTDPKLGDVEGNLEDIVDAVQRISCDLMVLPECALQGYGYDQPREAGAIAQPVPGPATEAVADVCRRMKRHAVFGMIESDGDRYYNTAVLIGPDGIVGKYRRMHLPFLGVDRFTWPGDLGFPVFETPLGRIGLLICFDLSFPEDARALKLGGAQIICVPTNWPEAAEVSCVHAPMVRAQENHVWLVTANRVGTEAGTTFRGESRICDPDGRILEESGWGMGSISAEFEPLDADRNRIVIRPGEYEIDRIMSRRPDHYGALSEGTSRGTLEQDPAPAP